MKAELNLRKPGNYAFFDPDTRLHLTYANPVGSIDRVSSGIRRGIKSRVIIVEGVDIADLDKKKPKEGDPQMEIKATEMVGVEELIPGMKEEDVTTETPETKEPIPETVPETAPEPVPVQEPASILEQAPQAEEGKESEPATKKGGKKPAAKKAE